MFSIMTGPWPHEIVFEHFARQLWMLCLAPQENKQQIWTWVKRRLRLHKTIQYFAFESFSKQKHGQRKKDRLHFVWSTQRFLERQWLLWIHLCDCDAKSLQSKLNTWFFACKIVIDFCHTVKRSMKSLFLPIPLIVRKEWKLRNKQEWWPSAETHFLSNKGGFVNHFHTHDWRQHF